MHAPGRDEIIGNIFGRVDGDGETDARRRASWRINRRINANHIPVGVNERAAGVPAIHRCGGLDGLFDKRGLACLHGAADRANYSRGERGLKSKWISNSENFLSNLNSGGVSKLQRRELFPFGVDLYERDIVALVGPNVL